MIKKEKVDFYCKNLEYKNLDIKNFFGKEMNNLLANFEPEFFEKTNNYLAIENLNDLKSKDKIFLGNTILKIKMFLIEKVKKNDFENILKVLDLIFKKKYFKNNYNMFKYSPYDQEVSEKFNLKYYINASLIPVHNAKCFLAAQAPKEEFFDRFFELICKAKVELIVCLVNFETENIKDYAENLLKLEEIDIKNYVLQTFEINNYRFRRLIFKNWKDFFVPNIDELKLFTTEFNKLFDKPDNCLVHCKAGLGRTGTFIMFYIINQMIKCKDCDFVDILLYLRSKRNHLVFNEDQIRFLFSEIKN